VVLNISRFGDGGDGDGEVTRFGVISLPHPDGGSSLFRRWFP
jgi:hypothetical protein